MADRVRVTQPEGGRTLTKQSDALETDVNKIVARHIAHRMPLPGPGQNPMYGDFTGAVDYHTALTRLREAEIQFNNLPAHVRRACDNDPGKFLDLVYDPDRRDELVALGLVEAQLPPVAPEPEPAPPPAPDPEP